MKSRVVVTGMGVCAPGAIGREAFGQLLSAGNSGIAFHPQLKELNFSCQIAGKPYIDSVYLNNYFTNVQLKDLNSSGLVYGVVAGMDAWHDAQLGKSNSETPFWDSGVVFGTGILGVDKFREAIHKVDAGDVRRLGSTAVNQTMASGISAFLGGMIGAGNQVTTNSSACSTGTEAILMGFERIQSNKATKMLVGSCSDSGPYVWGGFDAMRILPRNHNDRPKEASRPMSASATGFVPGSGAGALVLESLESALDRGARIYAEIKGGMVNSGGQRSGGSMTAPNSVAVQQCILGAIENAGIEAKEIDAINGHLTATAKDPVEIENWSKALQRSKEDFPFVNSFKGHFGHCLAAAGSIEAVGTVLQLHREQLYGNLNCEDLHPEIARQIAPHKVLQKTISYRSNYIAKASFGFGDVNACIIFGRYND